VGGVYIIAEREARQLIVVQGSGISISICLFVCACVALRNATSTSFSVWAYSRSERHLYNMDMNHYIYGTK